MSGLLERLQSKKGGRRAQTATEKVVRTDSAQFEAFKNPTVIVEAPLKLENMPVVPLGESSPPSANPSGEIIPSAAAPQNTAKTPPTDPNPPWLATPPRNSGVLNALVPKALELLDERSPHNTPPPGELAPLRTAVQTAAHNLTREMRLTTDDLNAGVAELAEFLWGYGPLSPLFEDPAVTDIWVDRFDTVVCRRKGASLHTPFRFRTPELYRRFLTRLVSSCGAASIPAHLTASLSDRWHSRIDVVAQPLVEGSEPRLAIRIPRIAHVTMYELIRAKTLPVKFGAWLAEAAHSGAAHILVVGAPGSGRTTFATALSGAIGSLERVASIETVAEIFPPATNLEKFVAPVEQYPSLVDIAGYRGARRLTFGDVGGPGMAGFRAAVERGFRGIIGVFNTPDATATVDLLERHQALPRTPILVIEMGLARGTPCVERVREVIFADNLIAAMPNLLTFQGTIDGRRQWDTPAIETPLRRLIIPRGISPHDGTQSTAGEGAWQRS